MQHDVALWLFLRDYVIVCLCYQRLCDLLGCTAHEWWCTLRSDSTGCLLYHRPYDNVPHNKLIQLLSCLVSVLLLV